jgi:hypothetical protein
MVRVQVEGQEVFTGSLQVAWLLQTALLMSGQESVVTSDPRPVCPPDLDDRFLD